MATDLSFRFCAPSLRVCVSQEVELQIRTGDRTWDGCCSRQRASCSALTHTDSHPPFNTTPSLLSSFSFLICHFYTLSSLQPEILFLFSVTFNQSVCRFDCVSSLCVCSPIKHNSSIKEGENGTLWTHELIKIQRSLLIKQVKASEGWERKTCQPRWPTEDKKAEHCDVQNTEHNIYRSDKTSRTKV